MAGFSHRKPIDPPDDQSLGTVTISNVTKKKQPDSPTAKRQSVRREIANLLTIIDPVFQSAFLNVLEQDLHRRRVRTGYDWKIILEAYLVPEIPSNALLAEVAKRFYDLQVSEAHNILRSLGHQSRVLI